jgi:hypothetical protein
VTGQGGCKISAASGLTSNIHITVSPNDVVDVSPSRPVAGHRSLPHLALPRPCRNGPSVSALPGSCEPAVASGCPPVGQCRASTLSAIGMSPPTAATTMARSSWPAPEFCPWKGCTAPGRAPGVCGPSLPRLALRGSGGIPETGPPSRCGRGSTRQRPPGSHRSAGEGVSTRRGPTPGRWARTTRTAPGVVPGETVIEHHHLQPGSVALFCATARSPTVQADLQWRRFVRTPLRMALSSMRNPPLASTPLANARRCY